MESANEIQNIVGNIKYYSKKLHETVTQQFNSDYEKGEKLGINTSPGTIRYDSLACILVAAKLINTYCNNIEANLNTAVKQDKLLYIPEEAL